MFILAAAIVFGIGLVGGVGSHFVYSNGNPTNIHIPDAQKPNP